MDNEQKVIRVAPPEMLVNMAAAALAMLAIFLLTLTIANIKSYHYIGTGIAAGNTITVSGTGEVVAVPDTAEFTYTIDETAPDVATAQSKATTVSNDIISYLTQQGIADTDIQTTSYTINPQYSYQQAACPVVANGSSAGVYCPPGKQTITGYEVAQSVSVKVHDTSKAGDLLSGIGSKGASDVSGLTFTASNEKDLEAQARDKAIADARTQADRLASSLGVSLVRIVSFSENGNSPMPVYARAMSVGAAAQAPTPQIPAGQNTITSNVSVTYEIE